MRAVIEHALDPVFVVRWPSAISAHEVRAHFDEVRSILKRGRAAFVVDMRGTGPASASLRELAAFDLDRLFQECCAQIAGVAHVLDSELVHGLLTARFWLSPPPFPTLNTAQVEQGIDWAKQRLSL